jgi:hypothetical protein
MGDAADLGTGGVSTPVAGPREWSDGASRPIGAIGQATGAVRLSELVS